MEEDQSVSTLTATNDQEKDNGLYITCIGQGLALAMSHAKVLHLSCTVCHAIEFSISLGCKTGNHSTGLPHRYHIQLRMQMRRKQLP
jgi:hypothetical protein